MSKDAAADFADRLERALETRAYLVPFIAESEIVQTSDEPTRARISAGLYECARRVNDEGLATYERCVWAAIRMMAVFGKPKDLARLTEFLEPTNSPELRQVSLQAIGNVSRRGPHPQIPELVPLQQKVGLLASLLCNPEIAPLVAAIAIEAVVAGVALGLGVSRHLGERAFHAHPLLARQLDLSLLELMRDWRVNV